MNHSLQRKQYFLEQVPLFSRLDSPTLLEICSITQTMTYPKTHQIYSPQDPARFVYLLHSGSVKLSKIGESGAELIIAILHPHEIFGESEAINCAKHDSVAEVTNTAIISAIPREKFSAFITQYPRCGVDLRKRLSCRLKQFEHRLGHIALHDVPMRLAHFLAYSREWVGSIGDHTEHSDNTVYLSHQDIANSIAARRETVSLLLGQFQKVGWVSMKPCRVTVVDRPGLIRFIAETQLLIHRDGSRQILKRLQKQRSQRCADSQISQHREANHTVSLT